MSVTAAALIALAVAVAVLPAPEPRMQRLLGGRPPPARPPRALPAGAAPVAAAAVAALGALLAVGGPVGLALALGCAVGVPRLTRNLETRGSRRRRERLARQAPIVADLLAATVASGAPMRPALAAVGDAIGDPAREAIRPVLAEIDLGADPGQAWRTLVGDPVLGPIAACVVRSMETGAPLSSVLSRIAEDMRRDRQVVVEVAARAAGVKAVAPLAACFLPAFLLLGVVPVVAALGTSLLSS